MGKPNPSSTIARIKKVIPRSFIPTSEGGRAFYPPNKQSDHEKVSRADMRAGQPFITKKLGEQVPSITRSSPRENKKPVATVPIKKLSNSVSYQGGNSANQKVKYKAPSRSWDMFQVKGLNT